MSVAHDHETDDFELLDESEIDKIIGGNVKKRRSMLKVSQGTLGNSLGITFQQVQKYEKGANRIGGSRMVQIATALDCTILSLFDGTQPGPHKPMNAESAALKDYHESAQGYALARSMSQIEDHGTRRKIVELARVIADNSSSDDGLSIPDFDEAE